MHFEGLCITQTLLYAFVDAKEALTQHYGAIRGIAALGPRLVWILTFGHVVEPGQHLANLSATLSDFIFL
jgi:hypothetical protein